MARPSTQTVEAPKTLSRRRFLYGIARPLVETCSHLLPIDQLLLSVVQRELLKPNTSSSRSRASLWIAGGIPG